MAEEEKELITPQWLIQARKQRVRFILTVIGFFVVLTVLVFLALPRLHELIQEEGGKAPLRDHVALLSEGASMFKIFFIFIAAGCGGAIFMALTGKIDSLLSVLSPILLFATIAAVAGTIYVFAMPLFSLVESNQLIP